VRLQGPYLPIRDWWIRSSTIVMPTRGRDTQHRRLDWLFSRLILLGTATVERLQETKENQHAERDR